MEQAIRKTVQVGENGRVELTVPELAAGTTAEVIVLVPEASPNQERPTRHGWLKGKIKILPGFDDPIPGMEEYM